MFKRIVGIAGVPRSGTSWLGMLIDSSPDVRYRFQPFFSYALRDRVAFDSSPSEFRRYFEDMWNTEDDFLTQKDKRERGLYPTFEKRLPPSVLAFKTCRHHYLLSHLLRAVKELKLVGIVRSPCATIYSWLTNPKEFPPEADPRKEWRTASCRNTNPSEFFGFYKWRETAHMYLDLSDQFPDRFMVISYEQLVDQCAVLTRRIFDFADLPFADQTRAFVESCHAVHIEDPLAVFKDKSVRDHWRGRLDSRIEAEIVSQIRGTRLERFL